MYTYARRYVGGTGSLIVARVCIYICKYALRDAGEKESSRCQCVYVRVCKKTFSKKQSSRCQCVYMRVCIYARRYVGGKESVRGQCVYVCVYIRIYARRYVGGKASCPCQCVCVCVCVYTYIYTSPCRENVLCQPPPPHPPPTHVASPMDLGIDMIHKLI
jgi:hypothetical protein